MKKRPGTRRAGPALLLLATAAHAALDRPYTLRGPVPHLLEADREARIGDTAALAFASPWSDRALRAGPAPRLAYSDSARHEHIGLVAVAGEEYRYGRGGAWATDLGGILSGRKGDASFEVDARIFAENRSRPGGGSYDREDTDYQDESATGSVSYASYARYRGDFAWETSLGTFAVARDAAHWGPALFNSLVFNQDAVPFDQLAYHATLGPVRVVSLYGDLIPGPTQASSPENLESRNLYAHRYELALGRDWLLGASEQLILFGEDRPYLFAPVFPLFMAKGFMYEEANNGSLAVDLAWRIPGRGILYAEFLLDDLESPSSIILREYSQNKWGWVAGAHALAQTPLGPAGVIAEYARLEPWVYTHFTPNTAQAANVGVPLGNPLGPNAQNLTLKAYLRGTSGFYLGLTQTLTWKGKDPGSSLEDAVPRDPRTPKSFLGGAGDPDYAVRPEAHWYRKGLSAGLVGSFGSVTRVWAGVRGFL